MFSINNGNGWSHWLSKINLETMVCHSKSITHREAKKT